MEGSGSSSPIILLKCSENMGLSMLEVVNLSPLPCPPSIHLCITQLHTKPGVAEQFLQDVKDGIEEIMKDLNAKTTGMVRRPAHSEGGVCGCFSDGVNDPS